MNELYDLSHFKPEHVPFCDRVLLRQLKDAASAVGFREKCTSLAEMFSVELKFTVETLKAWYNNIIKPKFFEVGYDKKDSWKEKKPVTNETLCCICDFPLGPYADKGWFDHVIEVEHLFLRHIYSYSQMRTMSIDDICEYKDILYQLLNIFSDFEEALQDDEASEELMNFIREDFCGLYDTLNKLREDVEKVLVPKKPFLFQVLKQY